MNTIVENNYLALNYSNLINSMSIPCFLFYVYVRYQVII